MDIVIGPILKRAGGYVFDTWNALDGLSQGYPYRRIEDANYARNATIRTGGSKADLPAIVCQTLDEFMTRTVNVEVLTAA
jgi:hypothetical protein